MNFKKKFRENYTPERNICIDEYLSLWKGRLQFKIYIPSKREKYGVKIFINCENTSGYLLVFITYTEASTDYSTGNTLNLLKDFDSCKLPSKVVLHFLEKYIRQGYIVTVDNYYNSPELAETQTDYYGTLRKK